jgi:methionyl-tRNA formyltransferase
MRIVLLANNWVGWRVTEWLRAQNTEIAALVVHPAARQKYGAEVLRSAGLAADRVFDSERLREDRTLRQIAGFRPDLGVSVLFGDILRPPFLSLFPAGVVNVHPALLPYNRGQYPNVWSIVDGTPAGVTLHYIDAGIDTGAVLAQREVPTTPFDTGESLYRRLERAAVALFQEAWPQLCAGTLAARPQPPGGTFHRTRDVEAIDEIDLTREYTAGRLLNILRARTFPPHKGAYFLAGGRKVYVRVQLIPEEDVEVGA